MEAFVIKSNNRYMYTYYIYEDENYAFGNLNEAKLFSYLDGAIECARQLKSFYNINCKVVKVKIMEANECE